MKKSFCVALSFSRWNYAKREILCDESILLFLIFARDVLFLVNIFFILFYFIFEGIRWTQQFPLYLLSSKTIELVVFKIRGKKILTAQLSIVREIVLYFKLCVRARKSFFLFHDILDLQFAESSASIILVDSRFLSKLIRFALAR